MTASGPRLRTDLVQVYVLRRDGVEPRYLQLRRAREPTLGAWQPVLGSIEPGESAQAAAFREVAEETALTRSLIRDAWALEGVDAFFMARADAVLLVPQFAVEAPADWEPTLDDEHDAHRWVASRDVERSFMWPGQVRAIREIETYCLADTPAGRWLRLPR